MEKDTLSEQEIQRREDNAHRARELACKEFQGEEWIFVEEGIYLSPRRPIGAKSNYADELRDARILRDLGSTVYLAPEKAYDKGKKYDAIVDGQKMEFKNVGGNSNTLKTQFIRSRKQAENVFLNLETSAISRHEAVATLYRAKISEDYAKHNAFQDEGWVILKISGADSLIHIKISALLGTKGQKKPGRDASGGLRGGMFPSPTSHHEYTTPSRTCQEGMAKKTRQTHE